MGDGGLPGGHPPSPWVCPQGPYIFLVYAAYNGEVSPGTLAAAGVGCGWGQVGLTCRGLCTRPMGVGEGSQPCPHPILQVRSALQRMAEKKAAEAFTVGRPGDRGAGGPTSGRDPSADAPSFQARCSPMGPGFHSRPSCPWEVAREDPRVLAPPQRHLALRGETTPPSTPSATWCPSLPSTPVSPVPQSPQCCSLLRLQDLGMAYKRLLSSSHPHHQATVVPGAQPRGRACWSHPPWVSMQKRCSGFLKAGRWMGFGALRQGMG